MKGKRETEREGERKRGREIERERWKMEKSTEELEPLFDYSRVQPFNFVPLDDDDSDSSPNLTPKRKKLSNSSEEKNENVTQVIDCKENEEEDWLPPPPKLSVDVQNQLGEDSTLKQLRLKKQELLLFAESAKDVLRTVEESAKRELGSSLQSSVESVASQPSKPPCERAKIVISIQDKDGLKQFRIYMDDKFERLFKMYADKLKLDLKSLIFCFDGDKISPTATPDELGMEDNDIVEVHIKSS
ncbi:hypothetical protein AAG906_031586 [Vitis piasezkii]